MSASYYQRQAMHNVLIYVPTTLLRNIKQKAREEDKTVREIYKDAMKELLNLVRANSYSTISFQATYKGKSSKKLQMWFTETMGKEIIKWSNRSHVSQRSFCYTALINYILKEY